MDEVMRTNDPVAISYSVSLLEDAGIDVLVLDQHMSILDGSIGILPRRIMVGEGSLAQARRILGDAGVLETD